MISTFICRIFVLIAMLSAAVLRAEKIKVAIYKEDPEGMETYGETGIYNAIKETKDMQPEFISEMTSEKLKDFRLLIITKKNWKDTDYKPKSWKENVRKWVNAGHGAMVMHEVAGCTVRPAKRHYKWNLFPEIGSVFRVYKGRELVMCVGHPITKKAAPNLSIPKQVFKQGYNDYAAFKRGKNGCDVVMGILVNKKKNQYQMTCPAIIAGPFGKGRVILNGLLTGYTVDGMENIPGKAERHILLDGLRWLLSRKPIKKINSGCYIGCPMGNASWRWIESPDGLVLEVALSPEQLEKSNKEFIEPILAKVNPLPLANELKKLKIGILNGKNTAIWFEKLKKAGCGELSKITENELNNGLPGISVLVIADTAIHKKYLLVLKRFLKKGGKILASENAGYDPITGKYNLTELLRAGKYLNTLGIEYFDNNMPLDLQKKEIDNRRQEWFIQRCKTAYTNGVGGMGYFTVSKAFMRPYDRLDCLRDFELLHHTQTKDYRNSLKYVNTMAPLWQKTKKIMHKNMPQMPTLGYLTIRHVSARDINCKQLAKDCKEAGIKILTIQFSYIDRFYLPENKKGHITLIRQNFLDRLIPECKKNGIQCWVNVFPERGISSQYCAKHPEECIVDSRGNVVKKRLCPVRNGRGFKYNLDFLEKLFDKYQYVNGLSLDEPHILPNHCFCPECRKKFAKMFPGKKMSVNSSEFRKFREHVWRKYYVEPYVKFMRRKRPQKGVFMLASPGHNKPNWSQTTDNLVNSGIQVFCNENAQSRSQCMVSEYWAKFEPQTVKCSELSFIKKHPVTVNIDVKNTPAKAVKADTFHGARVLTYVSDGKYSYPGIVARNDSSSVYFAFDPIKQPQLITNTLNWFIANDRHDVPVGMVPVPPGPFKMRVQRPEKTTGRYPDEMIDEMVDVKGFYIDKFEVTNKEYEKFNPKHKRSMLSKGDNMPVTNISMSEAKSYCNWRSQKEGLEPVYQKVGRHGFMRADLSKNGYRLPTVAEWQKAAAGREHYKYSWGNHWWRSNGRVGMDFEDGAVKVGSYFPNYYGLYDMTGNVWEWCEGYEKYPCLQGRLCGGSWHNNAIESRVEFYNFLGYALKRCTIGFRCARNSKN